LAACVELSLEHELPTRDHYQSRTNTQTIVSDLSPRRRRRPLSLSPPRQRLRRTLEGRGTASPVGDLIALTDPPSRPLTNVTTSWGLVLEAAPATVRDYGTN